MPAFSAKKKIDKPTKTYSIAMSIKQRTKLIILLLTNLTVLANNPTEAYLFSYSNGKSFGGLHFAWSTDKINWHPIGPEHPFLHSDYGTWGSQKRMLSPILFLGADQLWHCVWGLNETDGTLAHASSKDLLYWGRQSYPQLMNKQNCLSPEVSYDTDKKSYTISWLSQGKPYNATTKDFKNFSTVISIDQTDYKSSKQQLLISGKIETGSINKVSWKLIQGLINAQQNAAYKNKLWSETTKTDSERFGNLQNVEARFSADLNHNKKISNSLIGIFFEDINYGADGGLYAELIQNRDFEYSQADTKGRDKTWNSSKAWAFKGDGSRFLIDSLHPIHPNNKHYAKLQLSQSQAILTNEGFDGIALKAGEKYDLSLFARTDQTNKGNILLRLRAKNGNNLGQVLITGIGKEWKKYAASITAKTTEDAASLEIIPQLSGILDLDMISLFPRLTFKGHKNGLRQDLAQSLADLKPKFVRFPGGCVAHGDGLDNIYRWKNSIGPLESRKPMPNLWGYHQSLGLGYFEYFQFCEDVGASPLPVLAAGVPCQNSSSGGAGQQCGIPLSEMKQYIQDILDLVEYANGDSSSPWGKKRAEAGHPKPFNLKYIGIGNEDLITDIFEERFTMIYNAIKEKYPEITVIGTVGPNFEGTDYQEGWDIATKLGVPMVDEHYYQSPGWFIYNQQYYDSYDRSNPKVYLGEYASHLPGRPNNLETALAEALYLTSIERNADVVHFTSYAPLLAKDKHTQWNPNLIYFNNTEVRPTVSYEVQKLYGQNSGDQYIHSQTILSSKQENVKSRVALSIVRDSKSDDLIIKLVNLLPVPVKTSLDLKNCPMQNKEVVKTVLKGDPADKNARPQFTNCSLDEISSPELPPYSFTVYRLQAKKK